MTTLHDLKQALNSGETLVNGELMIWFNRPNYHYYDGVRDWHIRSTELAQWLGRLSDWRIRDQIGAELPTAKHWQQMEESSDQIKPTIMAVPIDEWNALQEELKELRKRVG